MKKTLIFSTLLVFCGLGALHYRKERAQERKRAGNLVGLYRLDGVQTAANTVSASYQENPVINRNIFLHISPDYSFEFYPDVPFIWRATGNWRVGTDFYEEPNYLEYPSYSGPGITIGQCCPDDSVIRVINMPPKPSGFQASILYFKKIKPKSVGSLRRSSTDSGWYF